jgi:sugar phosphate isomerase/epimerase
VKIGCHFLQWGIANDKETRHTWDGRIWNVGLPEIFSQMSSLHYTGFDCSDSDIIPYTNETDEFVRLITENKLTYVSSWVTLLPRASKVFAKEDKIDPNLPMSDPRQFMPLAIPEIKSENIKKDFLDKIDFAKTFSALKGQTITMGGPFILNENIQPSYYRMVGEYMNELAEEFRKMELKSVFHPHLTTLARNAEEVDRLYEYADKKLIGLLLDTAHLLAVGEDPEKFVRRYSSRIAHTHLKDLGQGNFLELGEGEVDFPGVMKALVDVGYNGWLTAELDVPHKSAFESAKANKAYLDRLLAEYAS